jgi:uncharacterized membrane protein
MLKISKRKIIVLVLLFCIIGRIAISLLPFDGRFFAGPDHYGHVHNVNLIKQVGLVSWDPYWYGGTPFLRFYPPLSFSTTGFLANFMDDFDAYKLVLLLTFSLAPAAAYLLFKEFFNKTKELLFATVLFSFTVHYASIADAGQFPTVFAIPFALLFLTFFIRYVNGMKTQNLILASIFFTLTLLGHLLVTYTVALISLIYLVTFFADKKFELKRFASSFSIYLCGFFLSSFWLIPTIIESKYSTFLQVFSAAPIYALPFINILKIYGIYPNFVTLAVSSLGGILLLYGIKKSLKWKSESLFLLISFLVFLAGYMGLYFLFPFANFHFSRWIVLMPIITTILITKALNKKTLSYLAVLFLISQLFLFMTFPERSMPVNEQQNIAKFFENKEGRTIYLPRIDNVFDYFLPKYKNDDGIGFFPQGLSPQRYVLSLDIEMYSCISKADPMELLNSLDLFSRKTTVIELSKCGIRENASDELFMLQNVRYVIINNNYPEVLSRFENDSNFTIVRNEGNYTIVELDKSSYIQTNLPIRWNYSKKADRIDIDLSSEQPLYNVSLRISEAWYPNWRSDGAAITKDKLEYIVLNIPELNGSKHITLEFAKPVYQQAGEWVTVIAWIGLAAFATARRKELFHLK